MRHHLFTYLFIILIPSLIYNTHIIWLNLHMIANHGIIMIPSCFNYLPLSIENYAESILSAIRSHTANLYNTAIFDHPDKASGLILFNLTNYCT